MRKARQYSESGFYHSMVQGINKQNLFYNNEDRYFFISLLTKYSINYSIEIHSYVLMGNHIHLLLKDNTKKISSFMQVVTSVYARFFNKKYDRIGHLFNDRFTSKPVEDIEYLQNCFSYILNNPENAGIAKTNEYKWSSYKAYKSKKTFVTTKFMIESFGSIKNLYEFIHKKNIDFNAGFIAPKQRPSEKKNDIIKKICKILDSENPIIPPDIPNEILKFKIKQLRDAGFSINCISRITGVSSYIIKNL